MQLAAKEHRFMYLGHLPSGVRVYIRGSVLSRGLVVEPLRMGRKKGAELAQGKCWSRRQEVRNGVKDTERDDVERCFILGAGEARAVEICASYYH